MICCRRNCVARADTFFRVTRGQEHALRALADHFRTAGQIIRQTFGHQIRLAKHRHIRPQRILKCLGHQRVVRAAQNGRIWRGHFAHQRINMAAHQGLCQNIVTVFDRINNTAAGLRLDINTNRAKRQFALKRAAADRGRGRKQRHMLDRHLTRRRIVAPLPFGQRFNQGHKNPQNALVLWNPVFLHLAQRRRTRGVAGQNHQITALIKQPLHCRGGQVIDIFGRAHTIWRMGTVTQIHKRHIRQAFLHSIQHRQPTQSTIKNTDRHQVDPTAYIALCHKAARNSGAAPPLCVRHTRLSDGNPSLLLKQNRRSLHFYLIMR